ncbi:MAG: VWA domain-containing protein [Actinobacteria bacterium]|nr:VWA domain-containing protein [Actinomycetota bacterium]
MTSSQAPELTGFDELFIEFAQDLRFHGMVIGSDDVITYLSAISVLDASDIMDVYWSGRIALVRKKDNIPLYNKRFQAFFLDIGENEPDARKVKLKSSANAGATLEVPNVEQGLPGEVIEDETRLGYMASAADISRHKAFADCSDEEINRFRKLISMLKVSPPKRRTYRTQTTPKGKVLDMRRMARETMRSLGEPKDLMYIKRKEKLRSIVFILDVSGSMADYSRNLLQLAYSARRANTKVEVFCFGTRLTRITKSIDKRTPDEAMRLAGESVLDWDGGTRIGDAIAAFVKESRRSRLGRGAIVVICSDGLDQGEPQALDKAMQTLSRLAHKVIWVNPHKGDNEDYKPNTIGMMIADPYIDRIFSGHNYKSIEEFARELSRMG